MSPKNRVIQKKKDKSRDFRKLIYKKYQLTNDECYYYNHVSVSVYDLSTIWKCVHSSDFFNIFFNLFILNATQNVKTFIRVYSSVENINNKKVRWWLFIKTSDIVLYASWVCDFVLINATLSTSTRCLK